jgi:iron complex outermembrane receptor protein
MTPGLWCQEKEKLLFEDIPVVITAAIREQPLTEAPSTITVITSDDIRYSGATNIPDILRMVAGVDVMAISARDQQVAFRGFNIPFENKVLLLLDGCPMTISLYGITLWDLHFVSLSQVERIEVVKSPISSIYGANAHAGVINIITRPLEEVEGTEFRLTAGSSDLVIGSILHGGRLPGKDIFYNVSAEWDSTADWSDPGDGAGDVVRLNAAARYAWTKNSSLGLSWQRGYHKNRKQFFNYPLGINRHNNTVDKFQLDLQHENLALHVYYCTMTGYDTLVRGGRRDLAMSVFSAQLRHTFKLAEKHSLIWGVNYEYDLLEKSDYFLKEHRNEMWAVFLEDEIRFSNRFHLTLGGRFDRRPVVGDHASGRGNIFYSPSRRHTFRLSVANAFRCPSFAGSHLHLENPMLFTPPGSQPPIEVPYLLVFEGNDDIKAERITSYELGYHAVLSNRFRLELNLFYNDYKDLFSWTAAYEYYGENELFPGSPGGTIPNRVVNSYRNLGGAWGYGGEIKMDFVIRRGVTAFVNYSYNIVKSREDNPLTPGIDEEDNLKLEFPKHKINGGMRVLLKNGLSFNLLGHWVDKIKKLKFDNALGNYFIPLDSYFIFNTRVGYEFWDKRAGVALSIFNLFNDSHYEYPLDMDTLVTDVDRIGRRIAFSFHLKF